MSKLYRIENWYRVLYTNVNNKWAKLSGFVIYDNKGIIVDYNTGYFDNDKEIEILGDIILKRKEDFSKKINYIMSNRKSWDNETEYKLYIHKDNIDLQFLGFEKSIDIILCKYSINGGTFSKLFKYLGDNKIKYRNQYEEEIKKINKHYIFPFNEEEFEKTISNITELNRKALEEEKLINDFDFTTLEEDKEKIIKRIKGEI